MTEPGKEQLDEDLVSAQKILETYRRNRRYLAEQQAELGGKLDLASMNQLRQNEEQITIYEADVARLKTEAVVGQYSLAEAEYRATLARLWSSSDGRLGIADSTNLEFLRLQRGIPLERAQAFERDVRARLAKEAFSTMDHWLLVHFDEILGEFKRLGWPIGIGDNYSRYPNSLTLFQQLGRAIRFDVALTQKLFLDTFTNKGTPFDKETFERVLLIANNIGMDWEETTRFLGFLSVLPTHTQVAVYKATAKD